MNKRPHTIEIIGYRELEWDKILAWLFFILGLLDFCIAHIILFALHLKDSSFWISADVSPHQLVKCMQCPGSACLLSLCLYYNSMPQKTNKFQFKTKSQLSLTIECQIIPILNHEPRLSLNSYYTERFYLRLSLSWVSLWRVSDRSCLFLSMTNLACVGLTHDEALTLTVWKFETETQSQVSITKESFSYIMLFPNDDQFGIGRD
jgi:hypothetical protein